MEAIDLKSFVFVNPIGQRPFWWVFVQEPDTYKVLNKNLLNELMKMVDLRMLAVI
jgi:hypothetical protein